MLTKTFPVKRNDGIDMLRGFSILAVILLHCSIKMPLDQNLLPLGVFNILFRSGYYGVIIFFVISGFLISTTALQKWGCLGDINYKKFYHLRFARIIPCLFALLILLSLLDILHISGYVIHTTSLSEAVFSALSFHINWLEAKTGYLPANWDVLWSLSVEEFFYLFFPLSCLLFKKTPLFIIVMAIFIMVGPFARTAWTHNDIWSDRGYLSCMDGIAIGCIAAIWANHVKFKKCLFKIILITGLSLFIFIFFFRKQVFSLGITAIGLNVTLIEMGTGLVLIAMHEWYRNRGHGGSMFTAPLRWFGRNSYEIYLTHMFVVVLIGNFLFKVTQAVSLTIVYYLIAIAMCGLLGQFVSSFFSEPLNQIIRRYGNE